MSDKRIRESRKPSSPLLNEGAVRSKVITINYPLSAEFKIQVEQNTYLPPFSVVEEAIVEMGIVFEGSPGAIQSRYIFSQPYFLFGDLTLGSYGVGT
jgi:hypothetical protein